MKIYKKRIKNIMSNEEVVNLLKKLNYEVENIWVESLGWKKWIGIMK